MQRETSKEGLKSQHIHHPRGIGFSSPEKALVRLEVPVPVHIGLAATKYVLEEVDQIMNSVEIDRQVPDSQPRQIWSSGYDARLTRERSRVRPPLSVLFIKLSFKL